VYNPEAPHRQWNDRSSFSFPLAALGLGAPFLAGQTASSGRMVEP